MWVLGGKKGVVCILAPAFLCLAAILVLTLRDEASRRRNIEAAKVNVETIQAGLAEIRGRMARQVQEFANLHHLYIPQKAHITVYHLGDKRQTDSAPWITASGRRGRAYHTCAVDRHTMRRLKLEWGDLLVYGQKTWTIEDTMNRRYGLDGRVCVDLAVRPGDGLISEDGKVVIITKMRKGEGTWRGMPMRGSRD